MHHLQWNSLKLFENQLAHRYLLNAQLVKPINTLEWINQSAIFTHNNTSNLTELIQIDTHNQCLIRLDMHNWDNFPCLYRQLNLLMPGSQPVRNNPPEKWTHSQFERNIFYISNGNKLFLQLKIWAFYSTCKSKCV